MARIAEHPKVGVDPAPAMRARLARAIALAAFSLAVMIGMPLFLYYAVGSRWPDRGPTLADVETLHLRSDTELLFGAIAVAGWGLWAVFTAMVLYAVTGAIVDTLRWGVAAETWRDASNPVRWLAGLLIGAIAALWPTAANATPPEPVDQTVAEGTLTDTELAHTTVNSEEQSAAADTETQQTTHVITRKDSLYSLAEQYLGNGERWPEIWEINRRITMSNGQPFTDPDFITDGTIITIPAGQQPDQSENEHTDTTVHIVQTGQHLYGLAEQYLGDGERWPVIWEANRDRAFADGRTFTDPDRIFAEWDLIIPLDTPATQPDNDEPDTEPELGPELEGEGEISVPHDAPSAVEPTESAAPPSSEEPTAAPEEDTSSTTDRTETPDSTDEPAVADSIPVGLWLSTGTFLAASTVALLAARSRRRKTTSLGPGPGDEAPVTGRLSDLEALIDAEQQRLTEAAEPETATMTVDPAEQTGIPIGADRAGPIDLAALATPVLGLAGPGHKGAARAAIIAALEAGHPVRVTTEAADRLDLDPDTSALAIIDNPGDLLNDRDGQPAGSPLVVCTGDDLDRIGTDALAEQLALSFERILSLGPSPIGSTVILAADGTVEADDGLPVGIEQYHIADAALLAEVLDEHTQAEPAVPETAPQPAAGTQDRAAADSEPSADEAPRPEPAEMDEHTVTATGFRLCVFGDPELYYNGVPGKLKQRARALTLLAALACADEPRTMSELLDLVVPDRPLNGARKYLNTIKANLRNAVRDLAGDDALDPVPYDPKTETFSLDTDLLPTDLAEFDEAEQTAALAAVPADKTAALERLVALHTGDLAPDIDDFDDLRDNYRAATMRACRNLTDHYAETGDAAKAAKYRAMVLNPHGRND